MSFLPALAAMQAAINHYIKLDPEAQAKLKTLDGRVLGLDIVGTGLKFYMVFSSEQIYVQSECIKQPDIMIESPPFSLARLFMTDDMDQMFSGDVEMSGDVAFAQQLKKFFAGIDIDWEYHLSSVMGDVTAGEAGKFLKNNFRRFKNLAKTMRLNVTEFLQEEKGVFPPKEAVQDFFDDVDALRDAVSRLEQRIKRLEKMTASLRGTK